MTLPDDLVKAVAEAICAGLSPTNGALDGPCERCQRSAPYAVTAVLRALPECEAVREAVATRIQEAHHEAWTPGRPEDGPRLQTMTDIADVALAAIAEVGRR